MSDADLWSPLSWQSKPVAQALEYPDQGELNRVLEKLQSLPPLVTSWEIERLKSLIAEAQAGKRFLLQGGDCAETLADCKPNVIADKLKILLQMSLVLIHGSKRSVIRVGRFAGQYAKPRSNSVETREGVRLPSYYGDLINRIEFSPGARQFDPNLMVHGYSHAAMTLNFIRSLSAGGFADLHHPEYWDLTFLSRADLPRELREQYETTTKQLSEALRFMEALGENTVDELTRVEFFTSHEGLNLLYESSQTRTVPRRPGHYNLTTHLPWIGERTRSLDGAHVEFFRGIRNAVGIKLGPTLEGEQVVRLLDRLNPENEPGKIVLITRMGASRVGKALPPMVEAVKRSGHLVLWVSDPMHGNTQATSSGQKTRNFNDILREVETAFDVHEAAGTWLGGVHFELTGEDVTECTGGGVTEADLDKNYATLCDPRLNYRQALEMAYAIAGRMGRKKA